MCVFYIPMCMCMSDMWVTAPSPLSVQTPHIMLQRGRNHVGAFLPHHEVSLWRPAQLQQWPLRPVQGESQLVLLAWTGRLLFIFSFLCLNLTFYLELLQCCVFSSTGSRCSGPVLHVGWSGLPEGEWAAQFVSRWLQPGGPPNPCKMSHTVPHIWNHLMEHNHCTSCYW